MKRGFRIDQGQFNANGYLKRVQKKKFNEVQFKRDHKNIEKRTTNSLFYSIEGKQRVVKSMSSPGSFGYRKKVSRMFVKK